MAPLSSFDADEGLDDGSGVFGTYPAPDEPLFLSALPLWTPPPLDSGVEIGDDYFTGETSLPDLQDSDPTSLFSLPPAVEETQAPSEDTSEAPPLAAAPLQEPSIQTRPTPRRAPRRPSSISLPENQQPASSRRKRKKSTADADPGADDDMDASLEWPSDERTATGRRTAHNMIEKRYRTNLNQKIAALRDVVPSLRVTNRNYRGEEVRGEDLHGLTPAHKLNKATVLSKATEYIAHLERRNKTLRQENNALKARIDAFEIMVLARQGVASKQNAAMEIKQAGGW